MTMQRRRILGGALVGSALSLTGCAGFGGSASKARVLVVGGGYGGATAAKYVRFLSDYKIDVTLIEPNRAFVSCPVSNLVIAGMKTMADITSPYDGLTSRHGVTLVHDTVASVDPVKKVATLASGGTIAYDKLVLAPGVDFMWGAGRGPARGARQRPGAARLEGRPRDDGAAPPARGHARRRRVRHRDPQAPYRCPPGPYERASVVAAYFKRAKPKSKLLILDGNPDVTSKGPLFKKAWAELYPGMVEYRPQHKVVAVDARTSTLKFEVQDDVRADVLNVLPPMRAGALAVQTGLANANSRWCHVQFLNFESTAAKDIHVIGDAILVAQGRP
jgi:NADPH-dependent 2,4-dienoyl-CoA reductase/sulfur reductase-like enzyme